MKIPVFFGKRGWWGEHGFVRVSFLKYLKLLLSNHVTKVRWVKWK